MTITSYAVLILSVASLFVGPTLAEADPRLFRRTWIATSFVDELNATWAISPGTQITARFEHYGEFHGSAGCNQYYAGGVMVGDSNIITMPPLFGTTKMWCSPDDTMVQEYSYLESLPRATAYSISDNTLQLLEADGSTVAEYTTCREDLVGIPWRATAVNNGMQGVIGLDETSESILSFHDDGSLVFSFCNQFTGNYNYTLPSNDSTISISIEDGTDEVCPELTEEESMLLAALQNSASYELNCDSLRLADSGGATQAYFGFVPPPVPPSNCTGRTLHAGEILQLDDAICSDAYIFGVTKQGKLSLFRNDTSKSVIWTATDSMGYDVHGNCLKVKKNGKLVFSNINPYHKQNVWGRDCSMDHNAKLKLVSGLKSFDNDTVLKLVWQQEDMPWEITEGGDEFNSDCDEIGDTVAQDLIPI